MASRQGGYAVTTELKVTGVKELSLFLQDVIAKQDLNVANRDLRQGAKEIARDLLLPAIQAQAASKPTPQSRSIAATGTVRSDRMVTVKFGQKNPDLLGYKRGTPARVRTALAIGSDLGPGPVPGKKPNVYKVARNENGYWARNIVDNVIVIKQITDRYNELLNKILRYYGKYS